MSDEYEMTPEQRAAYAAWRRACEVARDAQVDYNAAVKHANDAEAAQNDAYRKLEKAGTLRRIAREQFESLIGASES